MRAAAFAVLMALASGAAAQPDDMGVYAGGLAGRTRFSEHCAGACDDTSRAVRAFAGVQATRYFGMELGIASLGETQADELGVPLATKVRVADFSFLAHWPIAEKVALFGRLGAYYGRTSGSITDTGSGLTAGAGVQLGVTPNLALRIEWQDYGTVSNGLRLFDANLFGVAALWRF